LVIRHKTVACNGSLQNEKNINKSTEAAAFKYLENFHQ